MCIALNNSNKKGIVPYYFLFLRMNVGKETKSGKAYVQAKVFPLLDDDGCPHKYGIGILRRWQ